MDPDEFGYTSTFPNSSRRVRNIEDLKELFDLPAATALADVRSGIIAWDPFREDSVELKFLEHPDLGMYLAHRTWQARRMTDIFLSVGDREKLSVDLLMDLDDLGFALPGLFIPIEQAWLGIEDFFEDPLTLSPRIDWINAKDLPPWPER